MKLKMLAVVIILVLVLGILWYLNMDKQNSINTDQVSKSEGEITYIAIGDSYTIGNGVLDSERWPNILVKNLRAEGIDIELIANPAVSGYTVEDAIRNELPQIKKLQPDFVTVLIGANDNFGQIPVNTYAQDLKELLDKLQPMLNNPQNIVLVTIPDYSKSPAGGGYETAGVSKSIEEYNRIIKEEAEKRGLRVADIFPVSQTMTSADDYISDGLHPSAQGYAKWEKVIFPVVFELLKK